MFACLVPASNISAVSPILGKKYQNGVKNVTVWLNYNSGIGYWESYIKNVANNWKNPGWSNPINLTFVSSNYGSNMDFHLKNKSFWGGSTSILGQANYFLNGARIDPRTSNWYYAEIYINHDAFIKPSLTNDQALGTTIHEMGHAFGLDEYNTNKYSVMCQLGAGRLVQRVQKTDNDAVKGLYP